MRARGIEALRRTMMAIAILAGGGYAPIAMVAPLDGRALFLDPGKGNCTACHQSSADPPPATASRIGPPLARVKQQIPDRAKLREIIRDAGSIWPDTVMPPYGRHRILTEIEIDAIAAYVETL